MIRVLLADDHPGYVAGLQAHLDKTQDISVLGVASTGLGAVRGCLRYVPDVLVLDMEMPEMNGLEVVERLRQEKSPVHVLVLSAYEDPTYIQGVLDAGAAGYLSKQEPLPFVIEAIRGVANGKMGWLSRKIASLYERKSSASAKELSILDALSERERQVVLLLGEGLDNGEIAEALFITENTVKKHVNSAYEKLPVHTRPLLIAWLWRSGLLPRKDA